MWGDGMQTRSFCYVDDAVEGLYRVMASDYKEPLNVGTSAVCSHCFILTLLMPAPSPSPPPPKYPLLSFSSLS
eukprot:749851-Hanusia_phi.AAC.2